MRSTFSGFYVARQGLEAARANLQITGQNVANVHTSGYTRQRVDLYSRAGATTSMRYASVGDSGMGEGVIVGGINQLRDPYLDTRYRNENVKVGETDAILDGLNDLGTLFDSATNDGFQSAFSDLVTQLQALSNTPNNPVTENIVKTSVSNLLLMFSNTSSKLDQIKDQQISTLSDGLILDANQAIKSIAELNQAIQKANVSGNPALELVDKRNSLIDELSANFNLEVVTKKIDVGSGVMVDNLSINLITGTGDKISLIENGDYRQFDVFQEGDNVQIQLLDSKGKHVESSNSGATSLTNGNITDLLSVGKFHGYLQNINGKGIFDNPPTTDKGVGYYKELINTVARKFANDMNAANSTDTNNKPLFCSKDGGVITASNLKISDEWRDCEGIYITNSKKPTEPGIDNSTDNSNILYMISLFSNKQQFKGPSSNTIFEGTYHQFITNISTTLGIDIKAATVQNTTTKTSLADVDKNRQSISSVNLDEEAINMIMYNQALQASSRYMTTLDEAVENIITKMGLVGR